eukprot:4747397-Pleurochrysis_carterae.AAC.1
MRRSPFRRCLLRRSGLRRVLLAIRTRAFVAIGADMSENVGAIEGTGQDGTNASVASCCGDRVSKRCNCPAIALGAENVAS